MCAFGMYELFFDHITFLKCDYYFLFSYNFFSDLTHNIYKMLDISVCVWGV